MDQGSHFDSSWYGSHPELSYAGVGTCKAASTSTKEKPTVSERVGWFARRASRNCKEDEFEARACLAESHVANLPTDVMELSPGDRPPGHLVRGFVGETSSSGEEQVEFKEISSIRKSALYPNSEIDEQSCLKPSVARALFNQMANSHGKPKFVRAKKKRIIASASTGAMPDILQREMKTGACGTSSHKPTHKYSPRAAQKSWKPSKNHSWKYENPRNLSFEFGAIEHSSANFEKAVYSLKRQTYDNCIDANKFKYHSLPSGYSFAAGLPDSGSFDLHGNGPCCHSNCKETVRAKHLSICDSWYQCTARDLNICDCHDSWNLVSRDNQLTSEAIINEPRKKAVASPEEFKEKNDTIQKWFGEFTDEQKNNVLSKLLEQSGLPQIHLLSINMEDRLHQGCPPNCQDLITWLPKSISLYIFSFLDPASLCQATTVCKSWAELSDEPCLWRTFCLIPKWRLSIAGEHKQIINNMLSNGMVHWKKVFGERYRLRNNWLKGRCHVRTFEGHTQGVSCVQFDDTRIVSGSTDKTIRVWNVRTNTPWLVQTLAGHSGTVRCLHLDGNRLVSGSTDRTIKVWDLSMQQSWSSIACKVTLIGHTDTVRCIQVDDEKVISGSYDKTLKIWDIRTGRCKRTLRGHDGSVLCVRFDDRQIVSGSADKTIMLWDFDGHCLMRYEGHHDAVTCLQFDTTRIISGSLDCTLRFWDISLGQCIRTIDWKTSEGHTRVVRDLQADKWKLVSASDDRTIKVWSLDTCQRLVTLHNHTDGVTCVQFNDNFIVSGSYDKTVKLWDFSCC